MNELKLIFMAFPSKTISPRKKKGWWPRSVPQLKEDFPILSRATPESLV